MRAETGVGNAPKTARSGCKPVNCRAQLSGEPVGRRRGAVMLIEDKSQQKTIPGEMPVAASAGEIAAPRAGRNLPVHGPSGYSARGAANTRCQSVAAPGRVVDIPEKWLTEAELSLNVL